MDRTICENKKGSQPHRLQQLMCEYGAGERVHLHEPARVYSLSDAHIQMNSQLIFGRLLNAGAADEILNFGRVQGGTRRCQASRELPIKTLCSKHVYLKCMASIAGSGTLTEEKGISVIFSTAVISP